MLRIEAPGSGVQLAESLSPDVKFWVRVQAFHKLGIEAHACNPRALEVKAGDQKFKDTLCSTETFRSARATGALVSFF